MAIWHMSYVACDVCGTPGRMGDNSVEARVYAENDGFVRRPMNKIRRDLCPDCAKPREKGDKP